MFKDKKIFILGMARSGYEASKALSKIASYILITDMKEQDEKQVKEIEDLGVKFVKCDDPIDLLDDGFDFLVKNPGIKIDHPLVVKAKSLGIPVINEVEVAYHLLPKDITIIGITGSNGKTTTTTLIYEILKSFNNQVHLAGNIGYPLCSFIGKVKEKDILVIEISSHQLHDFKDFKTNISVMTNLSEVHLDHFGTYDYYKKTKARIFEHHSSSDLAILNKGNSDVLEISKDILSRKIYFSSNVEADVMLNGDEITYKKEPIININEIVLKGKHNYENIMCAISVAKEFSVSNDIIKDVLKKFSGVEHRLEYVKTINERSFYNDSKATNVESTIIALDSFNSPTILLLGGLDRGHSFDGLVEHLENVKLIVSFGETKNRIKEFAKKLNIECCVVETLVEAVDVAYNKSLSGDIILLSPACASWDQFPNFEQRGICFKNCVNNLK